MKYQILEAISAQDLEKFVAAVIADSWRPIGGVSVSHALDPDPQYFGAFYYLYAQAMVKEEE